MFKTSKANRPLNIFLQPIIVVISYQLMPNIWLIKVYTFHSMHYP